MMSRPILNGARVFFFSWMAKGTARVRCFFLCKLDEPALNRAELDKDAELRYILLHSPQRNICSLDFQATDTSL